MKIFQEKGAEIFYVELESDLDVRLERNKHPHRLTQKPSKRDTGNSERMLLKHEQNYRFNTFEDEFTCLNYFKINNTNLEPEEVARMIVRNFDW